MLYKNLWKLDNLITNYFIRDFCRRINTVGLDRIVNAVKSPARGKMDMIEFYEGRI